MKKSVLAGIVVIGVVLAMSGCGKNTIELDKNTTVAFDPVKDKPLPPVGGPGGDGKGKGKKGAVTPAGQ